MQGEMPKRHERCYAMPGSDDNKRADSGAAFGPAFVLDFSQSSANIILWMTISSIFLVWLNCLLVCLRKAMRFSYRVVNRRCHRCFRVEWLNPDFSALIIRRGDGDAQQSSWPWACNSLLSAIPIIAYQLTVRTECNQHPAFMRVSAARGAFLGPGVGRLV